MKTPEGLVGRARIWRRRLIVLGLVAIVALAGCGGLSGGDGTATPTETTSPTETGPPEASTIVEQTASKLENVDSFQMNAVWNSTVSSPNGERKSNATVTTYVDRKTDRIQVEQSVRAAGQSATAETYLVDEMVYRHNPRLAQQYGAEWVKADASGNVSQQFRRNDELMGHRAMLENASVTVNGTETVSGSEAYRLEVDVNETAMEMFYGFDQTPVNITELSTTVWVDAASNRILRTDGVMTQTTTIAGQTATTTLDYDERFKYVDVSITLPDAADTAVSIDQTN